MRAQRLQWSLCSAARGLSGAGSSRRWGVVLATLLASCTEVAPPAEPAPPPPEIWQVVSINGVPFGASATLGIAPSSGVYLGQGPCNRFQGSVVTAPFPAVILSPPAATRRACPDLAAEAQLFDVLGRVERMGVSLDTMTLFTLDGMQIDLVRA